MCLPARSLSEWKTNRRACAGNWTICSSENLRLRREAESAGDDRSAAALRQSEEKFRLAFQTSPDSINFNRLADGVYLDINEGFTKLTGYTRADAIGKSSVDLGVWCDPEERARMVKTLTSDGYVENFEARFRRKSGEVGVGLMSARVLVTDGEEVILSITPTSRSARSWMKPCEKGRSSIGQYSRTPSRGSSRARPRGGSCGSTARWRGCAATTPPRR